MAEETRDEHWGDKVARWTFIITVVSAILFVGASVAFVLTARGGF